VDVVVAIEEVLAIYVAWLTLPAARLFRALVDGHSFGSFSWLTSTVVVENPAVLIAHKLSVVRSHSEGAEARRAHASLRRDSRVFKSLLLA